LPPVLVLRNGAKVTSPAIWWERRRPEIVEDFEREVLGRVPRDAPKVTWTVVKTVEATVGAYPVIGKLLLGHVDNSLDPSIDVDIRMTLVTPAHAAGPVPVMMMFGGRGLPALEQGSPGPGAFTPPPGSDPPATEQLIADGWGYASIMPGSIQADNGAGLTKGIIGLVNRGPPRKPEDSPLRISNRGVAARSAQAIGRHLRLYGPEGSNLRLAGLCDAGEEGDFRRALERAGYGRDLGRADLERLGFYVCEADLEDELVRCLGASAVEEILAAHGRLASFRTYQKQPAHRARTTEEQLRGFLNNWKIRLAAPLVEALDLSSVPRPLDGVLAALSGPGCAGSACVTADP